MASKSNGLDASEWARAPPSGPGWLRFLKGIYNPDDGSFLGRTAKRWGIVLVFYMVFYVVLACLFSICMLGLYSTLHDDRPAYTLEHSLIGANPGVAFRPLPGDRDGLLVRYDRGGDNTSTVDAIVQQLDQFFAPYAYVTAKQTECVANDSYGYPDTPCFFVKLNKIYDWVPAYYEDVGSLPADMPPDLVEHITQLDPTKRKQVWISCMEEKVNRTKIEFPWGMGLPSRFYPFTNQRDYQSPLVAVRLTPAAGTKLTIIRCRAWAKNIIYNKSIKEPSGYTRIQLSIEDFGTTNSQSTV